MKEKQWVVKMNDEVNKSPNIPVESGKWSKRSIYRIPDNCVTDANKSAYHPQIVSIGPFHHGIKNLMEMEGHKRRAFHHFVKRSNKSVGDFVDALDQVVEDLKNAYHKLDDKWQQDTDEFLEMMIVDGCFILELLHTTTAPRASPTSNLDYAANDPFFSHHGWLNIVPYVKRDMLMLENQLPMLVLEKLDSVQNVNSRQRVTELIFKFFSQTSSANQLQLNNSLHILDLYRKSLLGNRSRSQKANTEDCVIRSATELYESGIFIQRSKTGSLQDISFRGRTLRLPLIVVDDASESLYLNLIAFERFHFGAGNEVTSYIFFMNNIINNAQDVSLLHSCMIIQNALGSDKAVANLFHSLCKDITLEPESSLGDVGMMVSDYCRKPWVRWRLKLKHTYCRNPLDVLTVLAIIFTIIQTFAAVLPYVIPPRK